MAVFQISMALGAPKTKRMFAPTPWRINCRTGRAGLRKGAEMVLIRGAAMLKDVSRLEKVEVAVGEGSMKGLDEKMVAATFECG